MQVSQDGTFPQHVCTKCWHVTESFHQFFQTVQKAEQQFLSDHCKAECDPISEDDPIHIPEPNDIHELYPACDNPIESIRMYVPHLYSSVSLNDLDRSVKSASLPSTSDLTVVASVKTEITTASRVQPKEFSKVPNKEHDSFGRFGLIIHSFEPFPFL